MTPVELEQLFHETRDAIEVASPDPASVIARGRKVRRTRIAVAVGGVGVCAALIVGLILTLPGGKKPDTADTIDLPGVFPAWASDGVLHFDDVTVDVKGDDGPYSLAEVDGGVAYTAYDLGEKHNVVRFAHDDGTTTTLSDNAGMVVLSDPETGWLSWVEDTVDVHAPTIVVYDPATGETVASHDLLYKGARWEWLDEGSYPIAFDDGTLYYAAEDGDYFWAVGVEEPRRVTEPQMLLSDTRGGTELVVEQDTARAFLSRESGVLHPVDVGPLSPDGSWMLLTTHSGPLIRLGTARVADTSTGAETQLRLPDHFKIDAAVFGDNEHVVLTGTTRPIPRPSGNVDGVVSSAPDPPYDFVECEIATGSCLTAASDAAPGQVVFAHR